jgi:TonB family protein
VRGEIVLLLELDPTGGVADVRIDSSDLPDFDRFVADEVRSWRFSPPTRQGRPVRAWARLPIPIHVAGRSSR